MRSFKSVSLYFISAMLLCVSTAGAREATTAGEKLFISSVNSCDQTKISDLVAKGVDPTVTSGGMTALHIAAYVVCSSELLDGLIKFGIDPNQVDNGNQAPLHLLLLWNPNRALDNLKVLLKGGADPNLVGANGTRVPIVDAANNCEECVEPLLKAGAKPDVKNDRGEHAVAILITKRNWPLVEMLFKGGANPNELVPGSIGEVPPLCFALRSSDTGLIDRLIGYGADPQAVDSIGGNIVQCAFNDLLKYGGPTDPTQLVYIEENIRKIIGHGLDISKPTLWTNSVLHQVVTATYDNSGTSGYSSNPQRYTVAIRLAKFLISLGASPAAVNSNGRTPLDILLSDRGMSAYHDINNLPDFFTLATLLATKRSVGIVGPNNQTALMVLISKLNSETARDIEFVRYLIATGTDLTIKNSSGQTAYAMAMAANLLNIAWEIEQNGGKL